MTTTKQINDTAKRVHGVDVIETHSAYYTSRDLLVTLRQLADADGNRPRCGRWIVECPTLGSNSDLISTKREAFEVLKSTIAEVAALSKPAAPALSLMERMARAAEATRPAGCKTLVMG